MQPHKRMHSPTPQEQPPMKKMHPSAVQQSQKRMFPTPQYEEQPMKRTMHVYNTPTPGAMAIRRANVRRVLNQFGVLPHIPLSHVQLEQAFNAYTRMYPEDYDITREYFSDIATTYYGGKIRHKKHVCSYKKRSTMNKKRAKSMKKK